MRQEVKTLLVELFEKWSNEEARSFVALPASGSYREYYRISGREKSALGVYNTDKKENTAFVNFSKQLLRCKLPVPHIYEECLDKDVYLIEDLGDTTLFAFMQGIRKDDSFPDELSQFYKKVLNKLVKFQLDGANAIDFKSCYPRQVFDRQSMMWDLHYFKYYFLKLAKVPFDEQLLEDDFNKFCDFLLEAEDHYFLYRDFQSRNIMVVDDEPYFIDYQGGRKGALQYDVASLLYDAKANIPNKVRKELLEFYISKLSKEHNVNSEDFTNHYYGFVFIRLMQAMGAYGFRGFYEKKEHFLQSIPLALKNLEHLLSFVKLPVELPTLMSVLGDIVNSNSLKMLVANTDKLTVSINSFSYKRGIPIDVSGNGGGFAFDCRSIHNPGRYPKYMDKTGKDIEVIEFFENEPEMRQFLAGVFPLVDQAVSKYMTRKFKHLMVNFGCTGGQHRSVYSAENLASHLKRKYDINVVVRHVEQEIKGNII